MEHFFDRIAKLATLEQEFQHTGSSFVVIYGRRRVGKTAYVSWNRDDRIEKFILFSISGYSDELNALAKDRGDVILM